MLQLLMQQRKQQQKQQQHHLLVLLPLMKRAFQASECATLLRSQIRLCKQSSCWVMCYKNIIIDSNHPGK